MAIAPNYEQKIAALRLDFHPVRPDVTFLSDPVIMRRFMGTFGLVKGCRELYFPALRESYQDTLAATEGADVIISHPLTATVVRLVAEKTGLPWVSTHYAPLGFFSGHDLPVMPDAPRLSAALRGLGTVVLESAFACRQDCHAANRESVVSAAERTRPAAGDRSESAFGQSNRRRWC